MKNYWNKPKSLILKIMSLLSVLLLLTSILIMTIIVGWVYYPVYVTKVTENILNSNSYEPRNYINQIKSEDSLIKQLDLLKYFHKIEPTDIRYNDRREIFVYLIREYLSKKDSKSALIIASVFEKYSPNDFTVKDLYIQILLKTNKNGAIQYLEQLNFRYPDMKKYTLLYITLLKSTNNFTKANRIKKEFNKDYFFMGKIK